MDEVIKVNTKEFYDNHYNVYLWPGCGYRLQCFDVYANNIEHALEIVVAYCDNNDLHGFLIEPEEITEEEEDLIYIDATMEGAKKPYFIYSELKTKEIE